MNLEQARFNMIEQQIRPAEVLDAKVLDTIGNTPREDFVPEEYRDLAFADIAIPLGDGEVMMKPILEARFLQALAILPSDRALEIGTGSGYFTALLASLAQHVDSIEINPNFLQQAEARLAAHDIGNVTLSEGDAARGWNEGGNYDVIAITGSLPILPEAYKQKLNVDGRLIAVVGTAPVMEVQLVTRLSEDEWATQGLFETVLPPLKHAEQPPQFVF